VLVAGAVALLAAAPEAQADTCRERNFVDGLRLLLDGTARATSSDGQTYDGIESGSFTASLQIKLCWPGALDGLIVHLGQCTGHYGGCNDKPIMHHGIPITRDFFDTAKFSYAIPRDSDAGKSILQTCNARAEEQRGAAGDLEIFPAFFEVTLGVDTRRDLGAGDMLSPPTTPLGWPSVPLREYSKTAPSTLNLRILCAPLPSKTAKVTAATLDIAISGDKCPKPATADLTIAAEAPGPVRYKIERGNGTTTTPDWIEGRIKKEGILQAEHNLGLVEPGMRKFRLWVDGWGKSSWKTVEVACPPFEVTHAQLHFAATQGPACPQPALTQEIFITTGPGTVEYRRERQGGPPSGWLKLETQLLAGQYQAVHSEVQKVEEIDQMRRVVAKRWRNKPGTVESKWVHVKTSCIDVADHGIYIDGPSKADCPLDARVRARFNADMEGPVSYRVACDNGAAYTGKAPAQNTGPNTFIAVAAHDVKVKKSGKLACTLQIERRTDHAFQWVGVATKYFTCERSGPRDFVPETKSDPQGPPRVPDRIADPPRPCPSGMLGTYPDCRRPPPVVAVPKSCPDGMVGRPPNCRPRPCPKGTVGTYPDCRRQVRVDSPRCPPGKIGRPPNCRPQPCPKGQMRVRGQCIRPAG
jgi:hypothetical protein